MRQMSAFGTSLQSGRRHVPDVPDVVGYLFWREVGSVQDQIGTSDNPGSGACVPRQVIESPGLRVHLDLIGFDAASQSVLLGEAAEPS